MRRFRPLAALVAATSLTAGLVVGGAAPVAADGTSSVEVTCSIPILGSTTTSTDVTATDSVDPVVPGGAVTNTIKVPIPAVTDLDFTLTVKEVKAVFPIPAGVTVTGVSFTPSSFTSQTWSQAGGSVTVTLAGSIPVGGANPLPTVPDIQVATTVAGPPRTVEWKVPSSVTAKASNVPLLGDATVPCTPTNANQVLITTTVQEAQANRAPTATDQAVTTPFGTARAVTLAGTDPDGDPLTFAVGTGPSHGTLSGTAPNLTYTPAAGHLGPDSFTFTASDGALSDTGTVSITVQAAAPGAPTGVSALAHAGAATVTWTAPASDGGSPVTGYRITPVRGGVAQTPVVVTGTATTHVVEGLANGQAHTFRVAAVNGVGTGPDSTASASVTPQGWLPFASWQAAVDRIHQWMLGRTATTQERALWVGRFQAGTHTPADLVVALRGDALHTGVVDPVVRLYQAFFLRVPDRAGILYWVQQRQAGVSLARVADGFARSPEFRTLYGSLDDRAFVAKVYENILGRAGEAAGITYWTGELSAGRRTRGSLMIGFSESPEYRTRQAANVDAGVLVIYLEGRTPTAAQRQALADRLAAGTSLAVVARDVLRSPAAVARATASGLESGWGP